MIFGNPGVEFGDGTFSKFSIVIEHLIAEFYSLNLCIDMDIIPPNLAYNMKSMFKMPLSNRAIFEIQSPSLFHLDDKELMITLAKQYLSECKVEEIIKLSLQPKSYTEDEINRYEELFYNDELNEYFNFENSIDYLWDIEPHEYGDRGWYVFVVNYKDETKLVIIYLNRYPKNLENYSKNLKEYERFFNADQSLKQLKYFDEDYWSVKVIKIKTSDIFSVLDEAYDYLFGSS